MNTTDEFRVSTLGEVAKRLRVGWRTVARLVRTGELRAVKIGRTWRVPETAIQQFLARKEPQP